MSHAGAIKSAYLEFSVVALSMVTQPQPQSTAARARSSKRQINHARRAPRTAPVTSGRRCLDHPELGGPDGLWKCAVRSRYSQEAGERGAPRRVREEYSLGRIPGPVSATTTVTVTSFLPLIARSSTAALAGECRSAFSSRFANICATSSQLPTSFLGHRRIGQK